MKLRLLGKCSTTRKQLEAKSCNLREYFASPNKQVFLISLVSLLLRLGLSL